MTVASYIENLKQGTILAHTGSPYHSHKDDPLGVESEYGEMLMDAVIKNKPKEIVEIGTGTGYSTSWLALGILQNGIGKITTYDYIDRQAHTRGIPVSVKFNIEEFLKASDIPDEIDFVFHDAQHRYELITADLERVMPRMSKDSQIWVHDVRGDELPRMMKDYFEQRGFAFAHFPTGNGMGKAIRGNTL